jgi:hypothetical protein
MSDSAADAKYAMDKFKAIDTDVATLDGWVMEDVRLLIDIYHILWRLDTYVDVDEDLIKLHNTLRDNFKELHSELHSVQSIIDAFHQENSAIGSFKNAIPTLKEFGGEGAVERALKKFCIPEYLKWDALESLATFIYARVGPELELTTPDKVFHESLNEQWITLQTEIERLQQEQKVAKPLQQFCAEIGSISIFRRMRGPRADWIGLEAEADAEADAEEAAAAAAYPKAKFNAIVKEVATLRTKELPHDVVTMITLFEIISSIANYMDPECKTAIEWYNSLYQVYVHTAVKTLMDKVIYHQENSVNGFQNAIPTLEQFGEVERARQKYGIPENLKLDAVEALATLIFKPWAMGTPDDVLKRSLFQQELTFIRQIQRLQQEQQVVEASLQLCVKKIGRDVCKRPREDDLDGFIAPEDDTDESSGVSKRRREG